MTAAHPHTPFLGQCPPGYIPALQQSPNCGSQQLWVHDLGFFTLYVKTNRSQGNYEFVYDPDVNIQLPLFYVMLMHQRLAAASP